MVRSNVVIVGELLLADRADPILLDNLSVQQFPHLGRGSEFSISSRVMRVFDPLHSEPYQPGLRNRFTATARDGFVDWTEFIATEPHGTPPVGTL
jgi:hypothetical protein